MSSAHVQAKHATQLLSCDLQGRGEWSGNIWKLSVINYIFLFTARHHIVQDQPAHAAAVCRLQL